MRAVELLRAGGLVAVPTETVYGLAANAFDAKAVMRIFEVKGRPASNPVIVHVASLETAKQCVRKWSERAERLASRFWPGPLTLVLGRSERIPDVVTAGGPTVGIRWPAQPLTEQLIKMCGFPLAAPSANISSRVSPTRPEHVIAQMEGLIDAILMAGPCPIGLESTVVDLTSEVVKVLRPGAIGPQDIAEVLGEPVELSDIAVRKEDVEGPLRSPGLLNRHYAPKGSLYLLRWSRAEELEQRLALLGVALEKVVILRHSGVPVPKQAGLVIQMPFDPLEYGAQLYEQLHRCDEAGFEVIVAELVPADLRWLAIRDRLRRAAVFADENDVRDT